MRLVVGLGNPGAKYERNRHNAGFMAVDGIVRRHGFSDWRAKFHGQLAEGRIAGEKVLVLKPETYMNDSGRAVSAAIRFYKIDPSDVIVLYDELDLALGRVKVKQGGGNGGHNGLKSLDAHIGKDYWRVRIGIGHPGDKSKVTSHVLGDFSKAEEPVMESLMDGVAANISLLVAGDRASDFMSKLVVSRPGEDKAGRLKMQPKQGKAGQAQTKQATAPPEDKIAKNNASEAKASEDKGAGLAAQLKKWLGAGPKK